DRFSIDLIFKSGGDRSPLCEHLSLAKGFLTNLGVQYKNRRWPELLSRSFNPVELAEAIWSKEATPLLIRAEIDGDERSITAKEGAEVIARRQPIHRHDGAEVCIVDRNVLEM